MAIPAEAPKTTTQGDPNAIISQIEAQGNLVRELSGHWIQKR